MIRTDINLGDGVAGWRIVSQVEHARVSGELARQCARSFSNSTFEDAGVRDAFCTELFQAIDHHDDGWAEWDAAPRLDSTEGKPLSFRELPLRESIENWSGSIEGAATVGSLAGWVVASHFRGLLQMSSKEGDPTLLENWVTEVDKQRDGWMAHWQRENPSCHTLQLAETALAWLQTFDVISLWLCSLSPDNELKPEAYELDIDPELTTTLRRAEPCCRDGVLCATLEPWIFEQPRLELSAAAKTVPARRYESTVELIDTWDACEVQWRLLPAG